MTSCDPAKQASITARSSKDCGRFLQTRAEREETAATFFIRCLFSSRPCVHTLSLPTQWSCSALSQLHYLCLCQPLSREVFLSGDRIVLISVSVFGCPHARRNRIHHVLYNGFRRDLEGEGQQFPCECSDCSDPNFWSASNCSLHALSAIPGRSVSRVHESV